MWCVRGGKKSVVVIVDESWLVLYHKKKSDRLKSLCIGDKRTCWRRGGGAVSQTHAHLQRNNNKLLTQTPTYAHTHQHSGVKTSPSHTKKQRQQQQQQNRKKQQQKSNNKKHEEEA
jgi:hypothetical protein